MKPETRPTTAPEVASPTIAPSERTGIVRPQTWGEATQKLYADLQEKWNRRDYVSLADDLLKALKGTRPMRDYLNNEDFLRWRIAVFALMVLGQATLFRFMGHQVRLMALVFPRRPLGPVVLGVLGIGALAPMLAALCLSVVGLPLAMALWVLLYWAAIAGKMSIFLSVGWGIARAFGSQRQGVLPLFVVYMLYSVLVVLDPFGLGKAFFILANVLGVGLAIRTRLGFRAENALTTHHD